MLKKFLLAILVPCTFCAGQSELTTPVGITQSVPNGAQAPSADLGQDVQPGSARTGAYPAPDATTQARPGFPAVETPATFPNHTRIAGPLTKRSEFEQYAEDATGRRLPVYGRQLFDEVPTTFAPVENVPVPADYVLGPGDQLLIRAWGKIDLNARETIDRNGQISLPRVGTLTVAGLRFSQVESYLNSAISALFKDFQLNVALGQLRTIQIFVLGDARQPGAYTVSSLSTLVDALFASGGPSEIGTMRRVQLRREGQVVTDFDLYDLLEKGDKSRDVRLLPGDVIYIPPIGPQIAISGDVNQPGIYELKGDTTVGAVLADAGGITSLADVERAVLERIENHSSREVLEFALDASGQARSLKDGDLLRVFPLSPKFANAVTLRGSVAIPGLYPWKDGMRVSDLIPSRAALITRNYWNKQNHLVRPDPNQPFANRLADAPANQRTYALGNPRTDTLGNQRTVALENQPTDASGNPRTDALGNQRTDAFGNPRTDGLGNLRADSLDSQRADALGNPSTESSETQQSAQPGEAGSRTVASIGQNSAEINWEYALIERLDERDLSTRLIPFNLGDALDKPASSDNQILKPGDVVTVFSRADLELPMEKRASFVRVGGEVNAPGIYRINPGDSLRDVVQKAGGLTPHSYLYASILTRESTRLAQEKELKQSSEQLQRELTSKYANATPTPGQTLADQQAQLSLQQAAIAKIAAIQPTGRVVLGMQPGAGTVGDIPTFRLEDGDSFYVPPVPDTVQVSGAVYNANAFRFENRNRLITYLDEAGGTTREADGRRIFVIRADGTVISRQGRHNHSHGSFENLTMFAGDTVVVPEKFKVSNGLQNFANYAQIISGFAMTGAVLATVLP
jgi:protein involved in polysaccharide export with SLBB domain